MSAVVQAKCPGCDKVLRLPADWVRQSLRCKHCGTVLQAKPKPSTAAMPKVGAKPATPHAAGDSQSRQSIPNGRSTPEPILSVLPVAPATPPASPVLQTMAATPSSPPSASSPLTILAEAAAEPVGRNHPRSRRSLFGPWLLVGFFLFFALAAGSLALTVVGSKPGWFGYHPFAPPETGPRETERETTLPPSGVAVFPRRALLISVNNYLYANPVNYGIPGHNVHTLAEKLATGLRIPKEQVAELSDAAPGNTARPPVKALIEKAITDYLTSSRPQDRILLVFIGHAVDLDDGVYLAPIEGELENKDTLIPLKWLYEKLSDCPARQKVLVMDVARFNPGRGQERPGGGPMSAKIDAALKEPPEGVQVWSACVADQSSYEFDNTATNDGMFVEAIIDVFNKGGLGGVIQKPTDPLPLDALETAVNRYLKVELDPLQKMQTSRISGKEPLDGAAYDPKEKMPPKLVIAPPALPDGGTAEPRLVRGILREIDVPSVKATRDEMRLKPESLPPIPAKTMEPYKDDGKKSPLRDAVAQAQRALQNQGDKGRLQEYFNGPTGMALNKELENKGKQLAKAMFELTEALDAMTTDDVEKQREQEPPRWQANYDYLLARLKAQLAYLNEYSALLGQMRKDQQPPLEPKVHSGWRVASQGSVNDATAKKLANESKKTLERLMKEHPDTPWAILAKRDHLTNLGLEWQPTR